MAAFTSHPEPHLASILPVALIGTARQAPPTIVFADAVEAPINKLLSDIAATSPNASQRLLRTAAVLNICAASGVQAQASNAAGNEAALDANPRLSNATAVTKLAWALADAPLHLKQQLLQTLAAKQLCLPIRLLPLALEQARRQSVLRSAVLPVLGTRGTWLAGQNSAWQFAANTADHSTAEEAQANDEKWATASIEQRCLLIKQQWQINPAAARATLAENLNELPARERYELIDASSAYFNDTDAPMLEILLRDRSKDVRQKSLNSLLRLPNSDHAARASARIAALLKHERALLLKHWVIAAPTVADPAWVSDAIEPTRPKQEDLGERAWWLYQLVRQVPLTWWQAHTGQSAEQLLKWAAASDWADAIIRGWRDVLYTCGNPEWCSAFLNNWPKQMRQENTAHVVALLPLALREPYWQADLQANISTPTALANLTAHITTACAAGETLSLPLSNKFVQAVLDLVAGTALRDDYSLRTALPELCCVLHVQSLPHLSNFPRQADETQSLADALHTTQQVIETRILFQQLFSI